MRFSPEFHANVPRRYHDNLAWRHSLVQKGAQSAHWRQKIINCCTRDPLFYMNSFCWTFDPLRYPEQPVRPFVTYPFQDDAITEIVKSIGSNDLLSEKTRDMGATWMHLNTLDWATRFIPYQTFLVVSRTKEMVDETGDPDTLFAKLDWLDERLPGWLRYRRTRNKCVIKNEQNESTINGEACTGNLGRGGRRTGIFIDEMPEMDPDMQAKVMSSTRDVTRSRLMCGTPNGPVGKFYEFAHGKKTKKLRMHWTKHPLKRRGLYTSKDGKLIIKDKAFWEKHADKKERYPFVLDGKLRSPWYDYECQRANFNEQEIAKELDIDYQASAYPFFPEVLLMRLELETVQHPMLSGEVVVDPQEMRPMGWHDMGDRGELKLWCPVTSEQFPPPAPYVMGLDISMGTGASNSALSVVNRNTGEKVAEYVNSKIDPHKFALFAVPIARWFRDEDGRGAFMIWEATGPGRTFGRAVIDDTGYGNIFYKVDDRRITKRVSDFPGWTPTTDGKKDLLFMYRHALSEGQYINRSIEAVRECRQYHNVPGQGIVHIKSHASTDPNDARDNHGDIVIADALSCRGIKEVARPKLQQKKKIVPGSMAYRREQRRLEREHHDKQGLTALARM